MVGVAPLIDGLAFGGLIADEAFDSNHIIADLKRARRQDRHLTASTAHFAPAARCRTYKWRHLIENFFCNSRNSNASPCAQGAGSTRAAVPSSPIGRPSVRIVPSKA